MSMSENVPYIEAMLEGIQSKFDELSDNTHGDWYEENEIGLWIHIMYNITRNYKFSIA